jgi:hypothetical protein
MEPEFAVLRDSPAVSAASLSGFRTGRGFNTTVLISVKTVVLAPIPSASVSTTKSTKTGFFRMLRSA